MNELVLPDMKNIICGKKMNISIEVVFVFSPASLEKRKMEEPEKAIVTSEFITNCKEIKKESKYEYFQKTV
ncbi:MAG: hypothetical protein R2750_02200 [Bacteroidales bacterium]